ncbi:MAG: FecR domain-containing protein [Bacteroidales bacterium]
MKDNTSNIIDDLIASYLTGEITDEGRKELTAWIEADAANKDHFLKKREIWLSSFDSGKDLFNPSKAYDSFIQKIRKSRVVKLAFRYAAAAAIVCGVAVLSFTLGGERTVSRIAKSDVTISSPMGSRTDLVLPDGTKVSLNAGSTIRYAQDFSLRNRNVSLSGEALFDVRHDDKHQFIVTTNSLNVKDIGTEFDIRDYEDDDVASVELISGLVQVGSRIGRREDIDMLPNQKVTLNKKSGELRLNVTSGDRSRNWENGTIFFNECELRVMAKELERLYDVRIVFKEQSLASERFYGSFSKNDQTVEEVMKDLSSTGKFNYQIDNRTITIY